MIDRLKEVGGNFGHGRAKAPERFGAATQS